MGFIDLLSYDHALFFPSSISHVHVVVWIEFFLMQFIFACNMFMHYHALHLSFPSFLSFVFYCVFLFFSYPRSFLTMAPKKSVPSKNPIIRRGSSPTSSSSLFVPDRVRVHDANSQKDFVENFCDREIHSEC